MHNPKGKPILGLGKGPKPDVIDYYICLCKKCGWCRDALIEGAERIVEGKLSIIEALTSPKWYEREAVEKYNEWKNGGLA